MAAFVRILNGRRSLRFVKGGGVVHVPVRDVPERSAGFGRKHRCSLYGTLVVVKISFLVCFVKGADEVFKVVAVGQHCLAEHHKPSCHHSPIKR